MDVALVIRQRLDELQLDQRDLARAASVTESYVSQILTRKKAPPAPDRTDIYDRMDRFLKLPQGELARVAEVHLKEERRRRLGDLAPLFPGLRTLLLRKCARAERETVRAIIERQSFGELERLVAQTLLQVAHVGADVFHITPKQLSRLGDAIASWEWEPASFALTIRTTAGEQKRFEYEERRDGAGDPEKGPGGVPARSAAQWLGHSRRARVSQVAAFQGPAAERAVLLSRAAEPQGSAAFSPATVICCGGGKKTKAGELLPPGFLHVATLATRRLRT